MWICPTFQRPDRLKELAESWEKHQQGKELMVRVWDEDPFCDDYLSTTWPSGWNLYESPEKGAGEALNGAFSEWNDEECYGFIGDDIVLKTTGGLEILEEASKPYFAAYPNDTLQRNNLCTHFCVGSELAKIMEGIVPPMFKHNYMDVGLANIAIPFQLLRYCPQVIFQHRHFINGHVDKDDTYKAIYPEGMTPAGEDEDYGKRALRSFQNGYMQQVSIALQSKFMALEKEALK